MGQEPDVREEITERLREACRAVRAACRELERMTAQPAGPIPREDVGALLDRLAEGLAHYFALEEEIEPFREVLEPGARLDERAAALAEEHGPLVSRAREIAARARGGADGALSEEVAAFLADLHRHEKEENEIVQKLYCEDIGRGD